MPTFYSFPHDFGEPPRELAVGPIFDERPATMTWPTVAPAPCHFPDLRPGVVRRMGEMAASYYSGQLARRGRSGYLAPIIPGYDEMLDEQAATRFPPGTRTVNMREDWATGMGAIAGSAMAGALDRGMTTAMLWGAPVFDLDDEAMREWMERMGIELPNEFQQGRYMTGQTLIDNAKTLRQRCFARLVNWVNGETGELILAHTGKHMVKPLGKRLPNMMAACRRDKKARKALSALPISRAPHSLAGDPEVVEALQDLADIVAWEARSAFTERYYPGVPGVDPLTDEHVDAVMKGMQREVDRENRGKQVPYYGRLPRARQVALAERRRHWFGVFGITPRSWKRGTWSLWRVRNAPYPEGYKKLDR